MKKNFGLMLFPAAVAVTMMLAACGSDDNSTNANNVERDDGESSSSIVEEKTSSSSQKSQDVDEESSSSSKSESTKKKARAATLEDLEKNLYLGEMFGTKVYLATGTKQGLFSLWIPASNPAGQDSAWIAVRSDFEGGVLKVGKEYGSIMYTDSESANAMKKFFDKNGKLKFIVNEEDQLQVSLNGGDYVDVEKASVTKSGNWLSDAADLQGVKLSCEEGDAKQVYSFYKGRYIVEESQGETSAWSAGYYDIQRSRLLMLPVYFNAPVPSMVTAQVGSDYNLMKSGSSISCEKSTFKYSDVNSEKLVSMWVASDDGFDWNFILDKSGNFSVDASYASVLKKQMLGVWDVYGDQLLLEITDCYKSSDAGSCPSVMKGVVKVDKSGMTYKHDDVETPLVPTKWELPQYE